MPSPLKRLVTPALGAGASDHVWSIEEIVNLLAWESLMLKWEELKSDSSFKVYRAKVPGGWIVFTYWADKAGSVFYPDPNHQWDGTSN